MCLKQKLVGQLITTCLKKEEVAGNLALMKTQDIDTIRVNSKTILLKPLINIYGAIVFYTKLSLGIMY
jgi:hypothetical protein